MRSFQLLISCFLFLNGLTAQNNFSINVDDLQVPDVRSYLIYKCNNIINIDGKADEADWQKTIFTEDFIDIEGVKQPHYKTAVKMLWDDKYLYVYAKMEEEHIWANLKEHDAIIFYNNDFEVFIDPDMDGRNYSEIEVNAFNTIWDLMLDKAYRLGGKAIDAFEILGLKSAVHIEGSLNDPSDEDIYWSVEMAIPMEDILLAKHQKIKSPKDGDMWRLNFSRVQWHHDLVNGIYKRKETDGKRLPEMNWVWSPQGEINMHIPELWGLVQFTESKAGTVDEFKSGADQLSIDVTYSLFRKFKFGKLTEFDQNSEFVSYDIPSFSVKDQKFNGIFNNTVKGFELILNNNSMDKTYIINESGELSIIEN